jgi:hypothetical protein
MKKPQGPPGERRSAFERLIKRRDASERAHAGEARRSLEGLRFAALMKQMQALQAIQGLQELAPRKTPEGGRLEISTDPAERERQRQWLEFKADWLQSMLDATLNELDRLYRFEAETSAGANGAPGTDAPPPGGKPKSEGDP